MVTAMLALQAGQVSRWTVWTLHNQTNIFNFVQSIVAVAMIFSIEISKSAETKVIKLNIYSFDSQNQSLPV